MDLYPPGWDEPIDEELLQAIEASYVSRSAPPTITSALDRVRSNPAGGGGRGGGIGSSSGHPPRGDLHCDPKTNGRRLPNWGMPAAAASPSSSYPSRPTGALCPPYQRQGVIRSLPAPIDQGECQPPRGDLHCDPKTNGRRLPNWGTPAAAASPSSSYPSRPTGALCPPYQRQGVIRSLPAPIDQGGSKFSYPVMRFGGHIVYSRTTREVERAAGELLETINSRKQGGNRVPVGFDIEWKPTFRKGETTRKAAVVQLCVDKSRCYVMHVIHSGIPSILKFLLGDNSSVKVGVGISNDATKMKNDYNVHVVDLEDLSSLANRKLGGTPKQWSLKALTEKLTSQQLSKSKRIRLGNWEAKVLSKQQVLYAATDAFVSWFLYEVLAQLPDDNVRDESALPAAAAADAA